MQKSQNFRPTISECCKAREAFTQAFLHYAAYSSKELAIRCALYAVWEAARRYQAQLETAVPSPEGLERQCYIDAIIRLLEKADMHKVDLVWTYASHLIKEVAA